MEAIAAEYSYESIFRVNRHSSLNPMALSKTKVCYSLNQPKMKEKISFREGESETELAVPPGVSRTKRRKTGKEASQRQGQTSCSTVERCLQGRRDRLNVESAEEREARLQQM